MNIVWVFVLEARRNRPAASPTYKQLAKLRGVPEQRRAQGDRKFKQTDISRSMIRLLYMHESPLNLFKKTVFFTENFEKMD